MGGNDGAFPKGMNDDNTSQFTSITNQTGVSIRTSKTMKTSYFEITPDTDFLILDLRNEDEFENYRIKEGKKLVVSYMLTLNSCEFPRTFALQRQILAYHLPIRKSPKNYGKTIDINQENRRTRMTS